MFHIRDFVSCIVYPANVIITSCLNRAIFCASNTRILKLGQLVTIYIEQCYRIVLFYNEQIPN